MNKPKVVALLTGRGNNTLTDKNILPVFGKPLLQYPGMAAKNCHYIDACYVSSDDEKILAAAAQIGYKPILRPAELALPTSLHIDAIIHALRIFKEEGFVPEILVVILANSVTIKTEWIDECVKTLLKDDSVSSMVPAYREMDHHPFRAKRIDENGNFVPFFDFTNIEVSTNRQDLVPAYFLSHNFWVIRTSNFERTDGQKPWTFLGNKIKPLLVEEAFDVHTVADLKRSEEWLNENNIVI
jgi:CMP-N,N'-diacetyllegionaminic acid synthase